MLKEYSLEGKKALVTGGSTGIGRGIALVLAEAGADVAVAARTMKNVEAAAADIRALGKRGIAIQCDVSDSDQVNAMVASATDEFGRIDILVNNAGVGGVGVGPIAPLPEAPPTELTAQSENLSRDLKKEPTADGRILAPGNGYQRVQRVLRLPCSRHSDDGAASGQDHQRILQQRHTRLSLWSAL